MLNISTGDTLRSVAECHTPNSAVLALRWISSAKALCLDSGGSVWSLSFTRRLGVRGCESKCLFSGARGEVLDLNKINKNVLCAFVITNIIIILSGVYSGAFIIRRRAPVEILQYNCFCNNVKSNLCELIVY